MSLDFPILLDIASPFWNLVWNLGAILLFVIGFLLVVVILIQDSKESGLGGAFGSGMGGESILGARGQKGITHFTAILGAITGLLLIVLVVADHPGKASTFPGDQRSPKAELKGTDEDSTKTTPAGSDETDKTEVEDEKEEKGADTEKKAEAPTTPPADESTKSSSPGEPEKPVTTDTSPEPSKAPESTETPDAAVPAEGSKEPGTSGEGSQESDAAKEGGEGDVEKSTAAPAGESQGDAAGEK